MLAENLEKLRERIERACLVAQRNPEEVTIVAVTKGLDASRIVEALDAGLTDIGENRVQEAEKKFASINRPFNKHLVGHLQTNKAGKAVRIFDLIQSVDTRRLADEVSAQAARIGKRQDILVQVNTSGEESKFGCSPDDVVSLVEFISGLGRLNVKGLMTIGPFTDDEAAIAQSFRTLARIADKLSGRSIPNVSMEILSMGMTSDFEIAIAEGSNMIRIGTALFGPRPE